MAKDKPPKADVSRETPEFDPEVEELEEFDGVVVPVRKKRGGGRPPKYRPEYARLAGIMLRRGASISELAEAFGVSNWCIHNWKIKHQEFANQFSNTAEYLTEDIERSLGERARGYSYDAVKIFNFKGIPVVVPYREHVPPDPGAAKHWLAVNKPEKWRIREEIELTGDEAFKRLLMEMGKGKKDESSAE